ncbi:MAG: hypothetical protein ACI9EF_001235 [Pseudohongiellaceae bacterium]|jgi:hypothetical protein
MTISSDLISDTFASKGHLVPQPCNECPTDDDVAGFFDRVLSASDARAIEDHALTCSSTHLLLATVADVRMAMARATAKPPLRIRARLAERGIALLNAIELTLSGGSSQQALGAARGEETAELLRITGPGDGLDEIELQSQADGTVRFVVSGKLTGSHAAGSDERTSIVLEVDGMLREKRPYSGERVAFAPLAGGDCRITVLRRSPGSPAMELSEARIELCA